MIKTRSHSTSQTTLKSKESMELYKVIVYLVSSSARKMALRFLKWTLILVNLTGQNLCSMMPRKSSEYLVKKIAIPLLDLVSSYGNHLDFD